MTILQEKRHLPEVGTYGTYISNKTLQSKITSYSKLIQWRPELK